MVSYDQNSGELVLHNYMDFLNLKDYLTVSYEVLCDGTVIAKGTVENQALLDIPAHEEGTMTLPVDVPEKGKAALKISYALKDARAFCRRALPLDLTRWHWKLRKMKIRK